MNITLSLDDKLVKDVRKIAVERGTTLTGLVRDYLEKLALENACSGRKRREREAPEGRKRGERRDDRDGARGGSRALIPRESAG